MARNLVRFDPFAELSRMAQLPAPTRIPITAASEN